MRSLRGYPRSGAFGATLLAAMLLSDAAIGDDAEPIHVEFHAPSDCPDAASFFDQVRARTTKVRSAAAGEPARTFTVTVTEEARKVRGRLTIEEPPGPPAVRDVTGEKCNEIVSALALITALAVDPRASTAPSSSLPAPPKEPAAPPLRPAPSASAAPPGLPLPPYVPRSTWMSPIAAPLPALLPPPLPPPIWRFSFGVDIAAVGAVAPGLIPGVAWFFDAERKSPSIFSPTLRASILRADSGYLGRAPSFARIQWMVGRLEGCPVRFSPSATVGVWPCALIEAGAIEGSGWGRASVGDRARPWVAPGLLGRFQWDLFSPVLLDVEGGATAPLVRDTFFLAPGIDVHQAPIVGGFLAVGVGAHFW